MKKDFLDDLFTLLASTGVTPEQYMIEQSLFFSNAVVDSAFNNMKTKLPGGPLYIRNSTKTGTASPYRNVGGTLFWNNIYRAKSLNNIEVVLDPDGNREVRNIIKSLTGTSVSVGKNSDIKFGKISHIWGETSNPFFFTGLWNIVIVPAYFNDILDKDGSSDPRIDMIIEQFKAVCWDKYDVQGKLLSLGLTPSEISNYAPKHKVAYLYNIQEIPLLTVTPLTSRRARTSSSKKQFSVNGTICRKYGEVAWEAVKIFVSNNPRLNAAQIAAAWAPLQVVSNQVETDVDHYARKSKSKDSKFDDRSYEVKLRSGGSVFVSNQFTENTVIALAAKVNVQPWGITIV